MLIDQTDIGKCYKISLNNGDIYYGEIKSVDDVYVKFIWLEYTGILLTIKNADIVDVIPIKRIEKESTEIQI